MKNYEIKKEPLKLDLQFFAQEQEGGEPNEGNNAESQTSDETKKTDDGVDNKETAREQSKQQQDHMIPKSRFDEINSKYKDVQSKLDEILTEKENAELEQKKKQGEFEDLYNKTQSELDEFKTKQQQADERAQALEGVINQLLEAKLESIDEDLHDIIPDGLTPEQKLSWVERAEKKGLFGSKQSEEPVGEGTNPSQQQTSDINSLNPFQMLQAGYGRK